MERVRGKSGLLTFATIPSIFLQVTGKEFTFRAPI
jgi:hypothetical protein